MLNYNPGIVRTDCRGNHSAAPAWADHLPTVRHPSLSEAGKCGEDQEDCETIRFFHMFDRLHLHRSQFFAS